MGCLGTTVALNQTMLNGEWSYDIIVSKPNIKLEVCLLALRRWMVVFHNTKRVSGEKSYMEGLYNNTIEVFS